MAAPQTLWGRDALRVVLRGQGMSLDAVPSVSRLTWLPRRSSVALERGDFPDRGWAEG